MNNFATILEAQAFKKVTYYTIKIEGENHSEFEKFIINHQEKKEIRDEFQDIIALIKRLGDKEGALSHYFSRKEKKAEALPPKRTGLNYKERKLHITYVHNLRLYCMRITNEIVFLFNGG